MMLAVTAATAAMAVSQDAQILAAFALTGGFSTPLLLSTGQNRELALFSYVALLDIATLVLVVFKPWRRLLVMSYAGTLLLYVGWYSEFYSRGQLESTLIFATLFFVIFAIAPLLTVHPKGEIALFASIPAALAFINAVVYFLQSYVMIEAVDKTYMAWFALGLAAIYIFLSRQIHARDIGPRDLADPLLPAPCRRDRIYYGCDSDSPRRALDHDRMVRRSGRASVGGRSNPV